MESKKVIKVTHIVEGTVDVRTVEGLSERFETEIVSRPGSAGYTITHPPSNPVQEIRGPKSRLNFALFVYRYIVRNRAKIDCIIVQGYGPSALAANLASRAAKIACFMLILSPIELYYKCRRKHPMPGKPFKADELKAVEILGAINARIGQQYLVMSDHLGDVVRGHGTKKPVHVMPIYGVDSTVFKPSTVDKAKMKEELGLPTSGTLIFFSSRVAPEKDSETLLKAIKILLDKGRNVWLLNRSGGYKSILEEAQKFELGERVIATDAAHPHHDLPKSYQASDICVQASREEGLGFSPLEALACGVPAIATSVGGLRETIKSGETGYTYAVGDADELANCMESIIDNPSEAERLTKAGRKMVIARYDKSKVFSDLAALLEETLAERKD